MSNVLGKSLVDGWCNRTHAGERKHTKTLRRKPPHVPSDRGHHERDPDHMTAQLETAAKAIRTRRDELGLTQTAAADLAAVSRSTWIRAETGAGPLSGPNATGVMRALGWTTDSYQRLLVGQDPIESDTATPFDTAMRLDALEVRLDAVTQQLDEFANLADQLDDIRATLRTLLQLGN